MADKRTASDAQGVDFGKYGPFLEDCVKHILKHKPAAIVMGGVLDNGQYIGAYYNTSIADKFNMLGNIGLDIFMDFVRENAPEIKAILDAAEDVSVEGPDDGVEGDA